MCGIFGLIGEENVCPDIIKGIKKLEYRGYDSSGIAYFEPDVSLKNSNEVKNTKPKTLTNLKLQNNNEVFTNAKINVIKRVGEIAVLEKSVKEKNVFTYCAVSHTRWATHGEPTEINAHPHYSENEQFVLVHNGIIENYKELKEKYLTNVKLTSDTDTEVVVQLVQKFYNGNTIEAFAKACNLITGSYAFALLNKEKPNVIYATKRLSPLVAALSKNHGILSSDISTILPYTKKQFVLNDNEYVEIHRTKLLFYDKNLKEIDKQPLFVKQKDDDIDIAQFPHFMKKEIYEIPKTLENTVREYSSVKQIYKHIGKTVLSKIKHIKIVACGTAYHAGLIGKRVIEKIAGIKTEVLVASEFRYADLILDKNTLAIFISQSGETADTIASLRKMKELGVKTLSIVNAKNSTITQLSDYVLYTQAGKEIAVASTKAYNGQLAVLYLFASALNISKRNAPTNIVYGKMLNDIGKIFENKNFVAECEKQVEPLSDVFKESKSIYLIGRQQDYLTALEASLKMKEITYIHCEAYPAGELKHGTISLIEKDTLVIVFITQQDIMEKTLNAIHEVKSRGAKVLLITSLDEKNFDGSYDYLINLPKLTEFYMPIISIVPIQLLSYHISLKRGINPDKPRNLAKSVTVE